MKLRQSFARSGHSPSAQEIGSSEDREILSQKAFHRVISIERLRTERSLKPFLLMLLDMGDHLPSETNGKHLSEILNALSSATRQTDVAGWYETDRIVGLMFIEVCVEERHTIVSTMIARVGDILREHLSLEQFSRVRFSFHVFPEDWNKDSKKPSNPVFYPDQSKQSDKRRVSGAFKRAIDIIGSLLALTLLSPAFLMIAMAIKASSKGPVFFRQKRVGQHGQPFVFFKFRSMYVGNDASVHKEYVKKLILGTAERNHSNGNGNGNGNGDGNGNGVFKLTKDSRITR
ncbi:MAG: sugar transferase, partial [Candidatus Sulfotelmatobacter sp.]